MAEVDLIEDVGGGAKLIGDLGQRHTAHTQPPQLVDTGAQRPDRSVYSGRGRPAQGRQHL